MAGGAVLIMLMAQRAAEPLGRPGAFVLLAVAILLMTGGIIGLVRNR
jgi:low affinity Fe/Cu permease